MGPGEALTLHARFGLQSILRNSFFPGELQFYHLAVVCLNAVSTEECVNETNRDKDALGSRVFKC